MKTLWDVIFIFQLTNRTRAVLCQRIWLSLLGKVKNVETLEPLILPMSTAKREVVQLECALPGEIPGWVEWELPEGVTTITFVRTEGATITVNVYPVAEGASPQYRRITFKRKGVCPPRHTMRPEFTAKRRDGFEFDLYLHPAEDAVPAPI